MQAHDHRRAHDLDEIRILEVRAHVEAVIGFVWPERGGEGPPPGPLRRLERAVRNEDAGRIGLLALSSRPNAFAVAAEVVARAAHACAGGGRRHRLNDAAGPVRLTDPVAAVRVLDAASGPAGANAAIFGLRIARSRRRLLADARGEQADRQNRELPPPHPAPTPSSRP